jgi:hypothetical protein
MTNSFTPSNWDELVSLRRECLALRLEVAQLRDVIKQNAVTERSSQNVEGSNGRDWNDGSGNGSRDDGSCSGCAHPARRFAENGNDEVRRVCPASEAPPVPESFSRRSEPAPSDQSEVSGVRRLRGRDGGDPGVHGLQVSALGVPALSAGRGGVSDRTVPGGAAGDVATEAKARFVAETQKRIHDVFVRPILGDRCLPKAFSQECDT